MSKPYFIESGFPAYATRPCDKCGLVILNVQDGKMFWNPNTKAAHRNICRNCFDVWRDKKEAGWKAWRKKHEELTAQQTTERPG
jgi:hypothetical protein